MSDALQLLDTPKRISLQSQSAEIRAELKDFERTFATNNNGQKPSKDDIKTNTHIAARYKQYGKIRDVLSGKLEHSALISPPKSPPKRRKQERRDSGVSWSPRKKSYDATPQKTLHPSQIDPYDVSKSISPKPVLLHAIGPTPQRDGRVLGLFDLLSNSAHSSKATPSSRKRKLDALAENSPEKTGEAELAQTPSLRRVRKDGDLLDFLTGTPARVQGSTPETGHRKHAKTPISEGRKFMLSQFFATPSAARHSNLDADVPKGQTPLRDRVLGITPENQSQSLLPALDTTPAYLRRSTSFKDRLLSASQPAANSNTGFASPPATRNGPPTLRHLRSVPKLFSDVISSIPEIERDEHDDDEYEDELDVLREMEDSQVNVLVRDSQLQSTGKETDDTPQPLQKTWKKRGQKRTTRRSNMKPVKGPVAQAPKFVAAGDESEDDLSQIRETQLDNRPSNSAPALEDEDFIDPDLADSDFEADHTPPPQKATKSKTTRPKDKSQKSTTINPNATSHMNFRTLKIKNKNSKAKGRGRFGRGRR